MANNSTYVPGMNRFPGGVDPYQRRSQEAGPVGPSAGTFVPGMQVDPAPASIPDPVKSSTPIVGFLYSVSNKGCTEYWPIHLGSNIIGRSADADIRLDEATVSERHAQISVKRLKKSQKITAYVQDIGSKTGMFLNDEELDYTGHPCQNLDVLQIGEAYTLLLILVDTDAYGLKAADNFRSTEPARRESELPDFSGQRSNDYDLNGTVSLDGQRPNIEGPGGTVIME